jgi:hypothetical protein
MRDRSFMPSPSEKLAESLDVLKALQEGRRRCVFRSDDLSRVQRERLVENGFLQEVMKGWLRSGSRTHPAQAGLLMPTKTGRPQDTPHFSNCSKRFPKIFEQSMPRRKGVKSAACFDAVRSSINRRVGPE